MGLRSKTFTDVILNEVTGFIKYSFDGSMFSASENYLIFNDSDYSGAGEETYDETYMVKFYDFLE